MLGSVLGWEILFSLAVEWGLEQALKSRGLFQEKLPPWVSRPALELHLIYAACRNPSPTGFWRISRSIPSSCAAAMGWGMMEENWIVHSQIWGRRNPPNLTELRTAVLTLLRVRLISWLNCGYFPMNLGLEDGIGAISWDGKEWDGAGIKATAPDCGNKMI